MENLVGKTGSALNETRNKLSTHGKVLRDKVLAIYSSNPEQYTYFLIAGYCFLIYSVYAFFQGRAGDVKYFGTYDLLRTAFSLDSSIKDRYQSLRQYWASLVSDPISELFIAVMFLTFPVPFIGAPDKLTGLIIRYGIYNLVNGLIVGNPSYETALSKEFSNRSTVGFIIPLVTIAIFYFISRFIINVKQ